MPTAKRVLLLTPQLPYPPQQGTAIRNFNLLARLAQPRHHYGAHTATTSERTFAYHAGLAIA